MARREFDESENTIAPAFAEAALPQRDVFHARLLQKISDNPDLLKNYTTRDIADTLRRLDFIVADEKNILIPLYESYNPLNNHEFRAWDLGKRVQLMEAITNDDALLDKETGLFKLLERYNELHARVYGFKPDMLKAIEQGPRFFEKNGTPIPPDQLDNFAVENRVEILSSGAHDIFNETISINTYMPTHSGKNIPLFHQGEARAAGLVLHEGRHTFMDYLGRNPDLLPSQEFRDVVAINYINTFGTYYLTGSDKRNDLNPCEKDADDFQKDMENFVAASPEERKSLILQMGIRHDYHLSRLIPENRASSLPEMSIAA